MTSFSHRHIGTAHDGRPCTSNGIVYSTTDRPRGCAVVWDYNRGDASFYRVSRSEAGAFRGWAEDTFLANDGRNRLQGTFPSYEVVNK